MTTRLYYQDSSLLEFEAKIVSSGKHDNRFFTVLDRSAFYPTSGGQQYDTGKLNEVAIVDVIENDSGDVWHISDQPVGDSGDAVTGIVDKRRRQRHRQQHTAQHILSQTFARLYQLETVSVHLGEDYGAIEFDTKEVTAAQLSEAEQSSMQMVFDNLPVEILFIDGSEIASIPLRRPPKREGEIRVIKIGDLEYSACGGTHCVSTAEVGVIKIIGTEKLRGRVLVKFLSGIQAVEDYRIRFDVSDRVAQTLTCHVTDLPDKLVKLQDANKTLQRELVRVQKEGLGVKAEQLSQTATSYKDVKVVFEDVGPLDARLAGQLATQVSDITGGLTALFTDGRIVIATSENCQLQASQLAKGISEATGLKGGGNPRQAQLGGADKQKLDDYRKELIRLVEGA